METAHKKMQDCNRRFWVQNTMKQLSQCIDREAARGHNFCTLTLRDIATDAENLAEIGEMCTIIEKELLANGYKSVYNLDGVLKITW